MEYLKLIALKVDDFSSSIFYEENFCINDIKQINELNTTLSNQGYLCIITKVTTAINI